MSPVQARCPNCAGPVRFKIDSSLVTVCEFCHSVIARGDRGLESLGKVSDVIETGAILEVGLRGKYQGVSFELTGRTQLAHPAGGVWDEWYAAFADGRWGWLAEAQGRFYLTFQQPAPPPGGVAAYDDLRVGRAALQLSDGGVLVAAEKSQGRTVSAQGEIPYRVEPGQTYPFVDLSGPGGLFGTIDYSEDPPLVFVGREVTLDDLGIPPTRRMEEREARVVKGLAVSCPQCGGPLDLRAPDQTERVGCPNCGALLDATQGNLRFLQALAVPPVQPVLPLGAVGKLPEGDLTLIGFMQRNVIVDGVEYFWEEYLLYHPRIGFRWLVRSDDHWNYVRPVPPGDVSTSAAEARFQGKPYKLFQRARAGVTYVAGEFYWKVEVTQAEEDKVYTADFIHPPEMLSREVSSDQNEINWSLGTYMKTEQVEQAFNRRGLPRPSTVGPNQEFPYAAFYPTWAVLMAAAILVGGVLALFPGSRHAVTQQTFTLPLAAAVKPQVPGALTEAKQVYFSEPFQLQANQNVAISTSMTLQNAGLKIQGELFGQKTGETRPFIIEIAHETGVDDGESYSEGSQRGTAYLSAVPVGEYSLKLEVTRDQGQEHGTMTVEVDQGAGRMANWILLVIGLSLPAALVGLYHLSFNQKRWEQSSVA